MSVLGCLPQEVLRLVDSCPQSLVAEAALG